MAAPTSELPCVSTFRPLNALSSPRGRYARARTAEAHRFAGLLFHHVRQPDDLTEVFIAQPELPVKGLLSEFP